MESLVCTFIANVNVSTDYITQFFWEDQAISGSNEVSASLFPHF